jgi:hypothetical protein
VGTKSNQKGDDMNKNPTLKSTQPLDGEQLQKAHGGGSELWIHQPESQAEDRTLLPARLCSCSDVCLAVIEDPGTGV